MIANLGVPPHLIPGFSHLALHAFLTARRRTDEKPASSFTTRSYEYLVAREVYDRILRDPGPVQIVHPAE